ncbi:MAG: hypothetical protein ACYC6L_00510 [Anaerolineae bacterium]
MVTIEVTSALRAQYPAAPFGVLAVRGFKPAPCASLAQVIERELNVIRAAHSNYVRQEYMLTEPVCHYVRYYRRFKKTYHILLQLESVLLKGKTIPDTLPAVQALLLAELKHALNTVGADQACLQPPLYMDTALGGENFMGAGGQPIVLSTGDLYLRDERGAFVSLIYGQDNRTRITQESCDLLFVTFGVEGVTRGQVLAHLEDLLAYLRVFDPDAAVETLEVI